MSNQIPDPESLILAMAKDLASAASLDPIMIGIHTGGVWVAERLYTELNLSSSLGSININFYRDDFSRIGLHPLRLPNHQRAGPDLHVPWADS